MSKRIVGYVISHSGKPGGPWEATHGRFGTPTSNPEHRLSTKDKRNLFMIGDIQRIHPAARILRLVRRKRVVACPVHSHQIHGGEAEELRKGIEGLIAKSVRAFDGGGEPFDCVTKSNLQRLLDSVDARDCIAACAALRAKRGG